MEAIEWHSRKINKCQNPYAKLIRDADKTANFRHYATMEELDFADRQLSGNTIREQYLKNFLAGYEKIQQDYTTIAEWCLYYAARMEDLNFEATKKFGEKRRC